MSDQKKTLQELIEIYVSGKSLELCSLPVNELLKIQFKPGEVIIIKDRKKHKPWHLHVVDFEKLDDPYTIQVTEKISEEGWFYKPTPI